MFYWLIGIALLIYYVIVNLRLHIPWFDVCWSFGVVELEWYPCCRLYHNWSVHVECGGWGLMGFYSSTITVMQDSINIRYTCG